jgi:hypothetical protein
MSKLSITCLSFALAAGGLGLSETFAHAGTAAEIEATLERDLVPAQRPMFGLGVGSEQSKITVDAWVDNPELTYTVGQDLKVFVRPRQTSYITVLNVGSSGRVAVIFPNFFQREAQVRAGQTVRIPGDRATWKIDVVGPPGVEVIKVIASKEPLKLLELQKLAGASAQQPVLTLGRSGEDVARDLVPQLGMPNQQQAPAVGVRNLLVRVVAKGAPGSFGFQQPPGTFGLHLKPEKPVYRIDEAVRVAVTAEADCRLTLISIGTNGQAVRLFPNEFQADNLIRSGQIVLIPSPRSPLQYKARGPAGVEGLIGTCRSVASTTEAPAVAQAGFATIGDVRSVTRDLIAVPGVGGDEPVEQLSGSFVVTD